MTDPCLSPLSPGSYLAVTDSCLSFTTSSLRLFSRSTETSSVVSRERRSEFTLADGSRELGAPCHGCNTTLAVLPESGR